MHAKRGILSTPTTFYEPGSRPTKTTLVLIQNFYLNETHNNRLCGMYEVELWLT